LVAGCIAFPVLASGAGLLGLGFLRDLTRNNPGLMELNTLLHMRTSARFWGGSKAQLPTDRQVALYIAHHFRGLITNTASWSNPMVVGMIRGDARKFAEQSVDEHPAPTEAEIAEADAAIDKYLPTKQAFPQQPPPALPVMVLTGTLLIYVCFPALAAALLFRGGVVSLIAGVTYVRKDGSQASRLRLLWRAILAWCPLVPVGTISVLGLVEHRNWPPWLALALLGLLTTCSLALPVRGLQDRLAGTWPVPR